MAQARTALVIGGGIAGPVAAMALQKAGIEATVFEAYDGAADGAGGGLTVASNGQFALDAIGAGDVVRGIGTPIAGIELRTWKGRTLGEFGTLPGLPANQFVWRSDLYRALYDEAARRGIRIEHGKRLVGAEETGDAVTAVFADGTKAGADVLIGADGIRSTVRSLIDPQAPGPRYTGLVSFGARVTGSGLAPTGGRMLMTFGKRAFFGHVVFDDGTAVWFANLPRQEPMTMAEARAVPAGAWREVLRDAFTGDRCPAVELLDRTDPADLIITGPSENMPAVPVWSRGRMVLIGDSAHAASSSSGQGASLAAESAVELARCLRDLPHREAFATYERLRRDRVEKVIAEANKTNASKAPGAVGRVVRDMLLPVVFKLSKPEKMAWQFNHRIDWSSPVA
ncbi:FAD-dependent monooxygenase [Dactylosporangium sp. NBC_01737]|uniref:FAD-dependent oxidoreductase n=1 Tax=Dactylosporangium sp. NBC_01737 TaxID=2975959 RepID=UPI002E15A1B5|nr:FAD-dependent monooxygenase [Dactylosporangium sp. NBC_01737]